jgi:hypothetical protein
MKAAHIRKVRKRAEEFTRILGVDPEQSEENRRLWTDRMAGLIAGIRGRDQSGMTGSTHRSRRNERRAMADHLWIMLGHDLPELCDALIEANQRNELLTRALRRNGLDNDGNLLPDRQEQVDAVDA